MKEQFNQEKPSDELIAWAMTEDTDNAYDDMRSREILATTSEKKKLEVAQKMKRGEVVLPGVEYERYMDYLNRC